jgi:hypothetical protein
MAGSTGHLKGFAFDDAEIESDIKYVKLASKLKPSPYGRF